MSYAKALSLISKGRSNPSEYLVQLPAKFCSNKDFSEYIHYFTRAITLPGTSNSVMGLSGQENVAIQRNVISGRQFGSPVVMTFSDRSDLVVYETIKNWMDASVINSSQLDRSYRSLRLQYYDEIKADVKIYKTEPKRNRRDPKIDHYRGSMVSGCWTLINAIPLAIEQSTLSVEAADSLLDFTMSMAYESFKFEPMQQLDLGEVINPFNPALYETTENLLSRRDARVGINVGIRAGVTL